jgi:hypothetical protein
MDATNRDKSNRNIQSIVKDHLREAETWVLKNDIDIARTKTRAARLPSHSISMIFFIVQVQVRFRTEAFLQLHKNSSWSILWKHHRRR